MSEEIQTTNDVVSDIENGRDSPPQIPVDSPGSSVSSRLKEEYSQLLKYTLESSPGLNSILPQLQHDTKDDLVTHGRETKDTDINDNNPGSPDSDKENYSDEDCRNSMNYIDLSVNAIDETLGGMLAGLRQNIISEVRQSLMSALQKQHNDHVTAIEKFQTDKLSHQKEVNRLSEQLDSLETKAKQKCTVIKNLTDSLVAHKKKVEMAKHFYHWRADHHDIQREIFTEKLAVQHHERKLNIRVLKAWYGLIQSRWRARTDRKSQTQAKEVCLSLTNDYETKIAMLNEKISSLENKNSLLQSEKEMYSEQVKKAFMRGMCALNMETMSVFGEEQVKQYNGLDESARDIQEVLTFDGLSMVSTTDDVIDQNSQIPSDCVTSNNSCRPARTGSPTRSVGHQPNRQETESRQPHHTTVTFSSKPMKVTKTKPKSGSKGQVNNKVVSPCQVLAPPMASVVVERHPPINKTMGKATAVRYPKMNPGSIDANISNGNSRRKWRGDTSYKPLAGQRDDGRSMEGCIKIVE